MIRIRFNIEDISSLISTCLMSRHGAPLLAIHVQRPTAQMANTQGQSVSGRSDFSALPRPQPYHVALVLLRASRQGQVFGAAVRMQQVVVSFLRCRQSHPDWSQGRRPGQLWYLIFYVGPVLDYTNIIHIQDISGGCRWSKILSRRQAAAGAVSPVAEESEEAHLCRWCHGAMAPWWFCVPNVLDLSLTCRCFCWSGFENSKTAPALECLVLALRCFEDFESASASFCHTPPKASPAAGLEVWQAPSFILVRRCFELGHVSIIEFIHSKVTCSKEVLKFNMTFDKGTAKRHRRKACVNSILSYLTQVAFQYPSTLKIFRRSILNKALFEY